MNKQDPEYIEELHEQCFDEIIDLLQYNSNDLQLCNTIIFVLTEIANNPDLMKSLLDKDVVGMIIDIFEVKL